MNKRSGPFWDGVEGRAPVPRAAATLGLEFITADSATGTIELAFTAGENFTNPAGNVLGAFVAAMLYDTVGLALLATLQPDQFQSTLQLNVNFLRPVDRDGWSARAVSLIEKATWRSSRRRWSSRTGRSSPRPRRRLGSSRSTGRDPLPRAGQASSTIWPLVRRASRSRCASAAAARG
jgi:acyl-coenzyme A thioesterase PaaI-like protein